MRLAGRLPEALGEPPSLLLLLELLLLMLILREGTRSTPPTPRPWAGTVVAVVVIGVVMGEVPTTPRGASVVRGEACSVGKVVEVVSVCWLE